MKFEHEIQARCLLGIICRETETEVSRCLDAIESRYGATVRGMVADRLTRR